MRRSVLSVILGSPLFIYLVFLPMKANLIASIAAALPKENESTFNLLAYAHKYDPCNVRILVTMGDIAMDKRNAYQALWSYGHAMQCQPSSALIRVKYGETLLMAGFNGIFALKEALKLEPNNPVFQNEVDRITTLQLPYP